MKAANGTARALHLVNGEFYAGAERVQDLLALRLPQLSYGVDFVCVKEGLFSERRKAKDAPLQCYPMRTKFDAGPAIRIARLAKERRCSLIHTHSPRTALLGRLAARMAGLPMVHHVHSPTAQDTEGAWRNARNAFAERLGLGGAARLICVSESLERYLLDRGFPADRIATVWNGVPTQEKARRRLSVGEPMIIGTVALFRPRKGVETLLRAIAGLVQAGCDVRLLAVGPFETEEYRRSVRALVSELGIGGRVQWTGFTDDVGAELRRMHVFVLPSLFGEGTPMVILEAMAIGLPIVSTHVEGIPAVVRNGRDGLLVSPGSVEEMAEALRRLSSREIDGEALGDSAWLRQRDAFSDLSMAGAVAELYREVIDTHR